MKLSYPVQSLFMIRTPTLFTSFSYKKCPQRRLLLLIRPLPGLNMVVSTTELNAETWRERGSSGSTLWHTAARRSRSNECQSRWGERASVCVELRSHLFLQLGRFKSSLLLVCCTTGRPVTSRNANWFVFREWRSSGSPPSAHDLTPCHI